MSMSLNSTLMDYAKSLERTSLKGYSSLSSKVLRSKAGNSNTATNSSASGKSSKNENSNAIETGENKNTPKKTVTRDSEIFYNNYLLKTSSDKSYVIDGVEFNSEEVEAVRSALQNAVSPLLGGKLYYDYKDYAQMGIAESSVAKYAAENLTQEQAEVVNKSLSGYIENLLGKEQDWLNSECHIDNTEGVGDTGEMNTYYGVRMNETVTSKRMREQLEKDLAKFNAAAAKYKVSGQNSGSKSVSNNHSVEGSTRGFIYCASNKELAGSVRSLFSGIDITDASQLADAFKEYKNRMTAAYRAVGFGGTTNNMLNDDTNSFTKQVSNMKAIISGVNKNGINYGL